MCHQWIPKICRARGLEETVLPIKIAVVFQFNGNKMRDIGDNKDSVRLSACGGWWSIGVSIGRTVSWDKRVAVVETRLLVEFWRTISRCWLMICSDTMRKFGEEVLTEPFIIVYISDHIIWSDRVSGLMRLNKSKIKSYIPIWQLCKSWKKHNHGYYSRISRYLEKGKKKGQRIYRFFSHHCML